MEPSELGLQDPKMVGASEYRALYDLLTEVLDGCEDDVAEKPAQFAMQVLDEVLRYATEMKMTVHAYIRREEGQTDGTD